MKEKKSDMSKKRNLDKVKRGAGIWIGSITAAFLAAGVIYLVLLEMEKSVLEGYEKKVVFISDESIEKGQRMKMPEIEKSVKSVDVDSKVVPDTAIRNLTEIGERVAAINIEPGVILTAEMFENPQEILASMDNPVIAGFRAEDLYQVAGGILRAGDRIRVYTMEEDLGTRLLWDELFIQQVFDGAGVSIEKNDTERAAQRINVYLEKEDVESFYNGLALGNLLAVKLCDMAGE